MEHVAVHTHVQRQEAVVKFIRADEMSNFYNLILLKHRQAYNCKLLTNQVVAAVNLTTSRLIRMSGKTWDQLTNEQHVWLVTSEEWDEYCEKVQDHENLFRHGKKIISRHPGSLSYERFLHFIAQFYEGIKPVDPLRRFTVPPPITPSIKSPIVTTPLAAMPSSAGLSSNQKKQKKSSPTSKTKPVISPEIRNNLFPKRKSSPTYNKNRKAKSPQTTEKALIQAVKAALQQPAPSSEPRLRPSQRISDLSPQRARSNYQFTPAALSSRYAKPLHPSALLESLNDAADPVSQREYEPAIPSKLNRLSSEKPKPITEPKSVSIPKPTTEPISVVIAPRDKSYSSASDGTFDEEEYLVQHGHQDDNSTYEGSSVSDVTEDDLDNQDKSEEVDEENQQQQATNEEDAKEVEQLPEYEVQVPESQGFEPKFELVDDPVEENEESENLDDSHISSLSDHQEGYVENKSSSATSPVLALEMKDEFNESPKSEAPEKGSESPEMKQARLFAELNVELEMIIKEGRQKSAEKNEVIGTIDEEKERFDSPDPVSVPFTLGSGGQSSIFDEESRDVTFNISDFESDMQEETAVKEYANRANTILPEEKNSKEDVVLSPIPEDAAILDSPYEGVKLNDVVEKIPVNPSNSVNQVEDQQIQTEGISLEEIAKPSPQSDSGTQLSPVDEEATKLLLEKIQKQAEELEQEKKARAELEARLDEARYLLKIIAAAGPRTNESEQSLASVRSINDTISELESALNKIDIKDETSPKPMQLAQPAGLSSPNFADDDSDDSAYDSNKNYSKGHSKSPRKRPSTTSKSPRKGVKAASPKVGKGGSSPRANSSQEYQLSPNPAKIAPIEAYDIDNNGDEEGKNKQKADYASDQYASDTNGTFITQIVSLKGKAGNNATKTINSSKDEEDQLRGYSDMLPSPTQESRQNPNDSANYRSDKPSDDSSNANSNDKYTKVTFSNDSPSDESPVTVPKSSSFLRKVAVLNSHRKANPANSLNQSNDDDIQYEEPDSSMEMHNSSNSDEPSKSIKNNRRTSDDFLTETDEDTTIASKRQKKNLLIDPTEDDDDKSDDSSHYPYAFEKTPKIRVPHRSGSGNLMHFLNVAPSLVPEVIANTQLNQPIGKEVTDDNSPMANFDNDDENANNQDDVLSKDPSFTPSDVPEVIDEPPSAFLTEVEPQDDDEVEPVEEIPPPPPPSVEPEVNNETNDQQQEEEDLSPVPPPPPPVDDIEEPFEEISSVKDEPEIVENPIVDESTDVILDDRPAGIAEMEESPRIESPIMDITPDVSSKLPEHIQTTLLLPPKPSTEPTPKTPSNVIRPINEVVQYIDTSLREDIISPLSVSISSDVDDSNGVISPIASDQKKHTAINRERIGTRTPLNQSSEKGNSFTTPPPVDITNIAPDSSHAKDLDMQFDSVLDNDLSESMIKDDVNVNNAVYNTTYTAPIDDRMDLDESEIDINTPLDLPVLDPFLSLISYYRPFLIAAKYIDSRVPLRGTKAYFSVVNTSVSLGSPIGISADEMLLWVIFQLYGNPTEGGIISRLIKTTHLSRALKEAKVGNVTSSQLDLYLVKVHAKLAANPSPSLSGSSTTTSNTPVMSKTGTIITSPALQKNSRVANVINANPKVDPSMLNGASFIAYLELLKVLYQGVVDQHGRGRGGIIAATFTYEKMRNGFTDLLKGRDLTIYNKMYLEYQMSLSSVLCRGVYNKFVMSTRHRRYREWLTQARRFNLLIYSESDIDLVRQIWERNSEQIRLIYLYYANTVETRRVGHGPLQLMMSLENCKDMLQDFEVLPQLIDVQSFNRIFRSCKLWEWDLADCLIRSNGRKNLATDSVSVAEPAPESGKSVVSGMASFIPSSRTNPNNPDSASDPYDIRSTVGHYSITLFGFIECITRIACYQNKLSDRPHISLENMMHLMDASPGKSKMLRSANTRKSVSVRHFVYNNNAINK